MKKPGEDQLFEALREALTERVPEVGPNVRRTVLERHAQTQRPRAGLAAFRLALAGFAVVAACAVVWVVRTRTASTEALAFQVAGRAGQVGTVLESKSSQAVPLVFSEGTHVTLEPGSSGHVERVTARGARVQLERGKVVAAVVHRAGAEWTFGAGPFEVAVLGTELSVAWDPESGQFALGVSRGLVKVHGPVIQGDQEVRSGQVCRVDLGRKLMELGSAAEAQARSLAPPAGSSAVPADTPAQKPSEADASAPATSEATKPAWVTLAQVGKHQDAIAAAERVGLPRVYGNASPESLLELARAARLAGRPEVERAALLACRKRAPGQATAAQAAYLLGRASAPAEAATWFEAYLHDQPRGLLAREASGRLVESYLAAGQHAGAARAAQRYLAAYPHGPHAAMARQVLDTDERRE